MTRLRAKQSEHKYRNEMCNLHENSKQSNYFYNELL